MIKMPLVLLLSVTSSVVAFGQNTACKNCMEWSAARPLTWDYFEGRAVSSSPHKAVTDSGLSISFNCEDGKAVVGITCYFSKDGSWTKVTDSDHLLAHEQLHFDITELFARKLRKLIADLGTDCQLVNKRIEDLYDKNYQAYARYQQRYDSETQHSIKTDQQKQWAEQVALELKALEAFSSDN